MNAAERFEYSSSRDPALNYCLWQYSPAQPAEDKFRSVNLLFQSFDYAGIEPRAFEIVDAIREGIGPFRTVFGVKLIGERLAWEFYFYDYERRQRQVSISRVLEALRPLAPCRVQVSESLSYFMFSLDLDADLAAGRRDIDVVHMYVGNPGSTVSSGIAYAMRADGAKLENFYFFFDAATQLDDAAKKICTSAYFDETRFSLDTILVPELRACKTICVANKQTHDCVYFSGVEVRQLLLFLERLRYPAPVAAFVRDNLANLDHLLFDVGFDYRMEGDRIATLKSGYYGVF